MKKLIYIFVALTAFSIGVACFYLRPIVTPVTVCQIKQNAALYDKQIVYVRGYLSSVRMDEIDNDYFDGISSLEKSCEGGASLTYSEKFRTDESLKELHQEIWEKNKDLAKTKFEEGWYLVEVEIIAEVNDMSNDGLTHCFGPDLELRVNKIKQISPIQFVSREENWKLNNPE
jgi:hypothetical protein